MNITRRSFGLGMISTGALALFAYSTQVTPSGAQSILSPVEANEQASRGDLLLVDIRQISEWRDTGVATSATLISMHESGFFDKLDAAVDGDHTRKIALICAVGGRSTWMQAQLIGRGYTNVLNVAEGMIGGRYGLGWIPRGLPIKAYTG